MKLGTNFSLALKKVGSYTRGFTVGVLNPVKTRNLHVRIFVRWRVTFTLE